MAIYNVQITWLYSVETLVVDTSALAPGDLLRTSEIFNGETEAHEYETDVLALKEDEQSVVLKLRYEKSRNTGVNNDSWGTSTITLKTSPGNVTGKASWKGESFKDYDGTSQEVVVTRQRSEVDDMTQELRDDLAEIASKAPATQREALILARIGQGRFRAAVTQAWGNNQTCPVTGIAVPELLTASHILAWRDADDKQRLDPANGLLLATHVDKLFDRHLLSFEKTDAGYLIRFHPRVKQAASQLGIKADASLPVENLNETARAKFAQFMNNHFQKFTARLSE